MFEKKIAAKRTMTAIAMAIALAACGADTAGDVVDAAGADDVQAPRAAAPAPAAEAPKGLLSRIMPEKAPPPPPPIDVPAGTRLRVRTTSTLSTDSNRAGESFIANLEDDVVIDGRVAFPKGSRAVGVVSYADKGGRVKGVASMGLQVVEIQTPDGKSIPVKTGTYGVQAKQTHTKDAQKIGIGAGVGAAIGAIAGGGSGAAKGAGAGAGAGTGVVLATRGDAAVVGSESVFAVALENGVIVD
jgi:hypothetical protein